MSAFDMTPVWVTAIVVERDWRFARLRCGLIDFYVQPADGIRPIDEEALSTAPLGEPITVQLPLYRPRMARAPYRFVEEAAS